jgi:hypothetical protein
MVDPSQILGSGRINAFLAIRLQGELPDLERDVDEHKV